MTQRQKAHDLLKTAGFNMDATTAPRSKDAMNHRAGGHAAAAPHGAYDEASIDPATGLARGGLPKPRVKGARKAPRPKAPHLNAKPPRMLPLDEPESLDPAGVPSAVPDPTVPVPGPAPMPDQEPPMPGGMKRGGRVGKC